jgi:ABC-type amino acid transport system permease subunit
MSFTRGVRGIPVLAVFFFITRVEIGTNCSGRKIHFSKPIYWVGPCLAAILATTAYVIYAGGVNRVWNYVAYWSFEEEESH